MYIVYCIVQGFRKGAHLHKHLDEHFVRIRIRVCSQELGAELLCYLLDLFHVCMHAHTKLSGVGLKPKMSLRDNFTFLIFYLLDLCSRHIIIGIRLLSPLLLEVLR